MSMISFEAQIYKVEREGERSREKRAGDRQQTYVIFQSPNHQKQSKHVFTKNIRTMMHLCMWATVITVDGLKF